MRDCYSYNNKLEGINMKKQVLPLLVVAISLVSCSGNKKVDPTQANLNELNKFFNAQKLEMSISLTTSGTTVPLVNLYGDDEIVVQSYDGDYPATITMTKTATYLEGDDIKAFAKQNNADAFTTVDFNYLQFVSLTGENETKTSIDFNLNIKELAKYSNVLGGDELEEVFAQYGGGLDSVASKATFENGKVKTMSLNLGSIEATSSASVDVTVNYDVKGYNDTLTKRTFDSAGYVELDERLFGLASLDITYYTQTGYGLATSIVSNSSSSYRKTEIVVNGEERILVGHFVYNNVELDNIYFDETTYYSDSSSCVFDLGGKPYDIPIDFIPVYDENYVGVEKGDELDCDILYPDQYELDYDNDRVLLNINNKVNVFDINTLKVAKEIEVEGTITNILVHKDVYHITTITGRNSSANQNDDDSYYGNIYVIDKKTLQTKEVISLNTCPYNTVIDKRGNIIIVPAYGQWVPLYLYNPTTKAFGPIALRGNYQRDYLAYDEEKDVIITNHTALSGAVKPILYICNVEKGGYEQVELPHDGNNTDYGVIEIAYKNYIIAGMDVVDVSDWKNPKKQIVVDQHMRTEASFAFAKDNSMYYMDSSYLNGAATLLKIDILENRRITMNVYHIKDKGAGFSFGFVKNGLIYLYDSVTKSFFKYDLD